MRITRARRIPDENHLEEEKSHLFRVFENNGYSRQQGLTTFQRACKESQIKPACDVRNSNVFLPFIQVTTDKITHILKNNNVIAIFKPLTTIRKFLRSVKAPINPKDMKGLYSIPFSCGIPYIGETSRSINQRIQEHPANIRHCRSRSSTLAEHAVKSKHHVCIEDTHVITKIIHFHHRKLREAIEIEKHAINLNRDDG